MILVAGTIGFIAGNPWLFPSGIDRLSAGSISLQPAGPLLQYADRPSGRGLKRLPGGDSPRAGKYAISI